HGARDCRDGLPTSGSPTGGALRIFSAWLTFVLAFASLAPRAGADVTIADGEDWSLPAWVEPKPYSGFFTMNSGVRHPMIRHIGFTLTWFDLNPREGVYDFHWVEEKLAEAKARGGMVMFRL